MQFSLSAGGTPDQCKSSLKKQADGLKEANPASTGCVDACVGAIDEYLQDKNPTGSYSVSISFYVTS
jgi:hypothetical protein